MRRAKRILLCFPQVPFERGGTEFLVGSLHEELVKRNFIVDVIAIPFQWIPKKEIIKNCMIWRLLDLAKCNDKKIDLVISTKFPSYLIKHPNKVTYLFHQFRQVYDAFGTEYSDFTDSSEDLKIRDTIIDMDNKSLSESKKIYSISKNVSYRLKKFNNLNSAVIYPPPKLQGKFYSKDYGDYILYVGRLNKTKRIDLLLKALAVTRSRVRCIIAGTGEEKESLEKLTKRLKLKDRVTFLGFVSDEKVLELYAHCLAVYYAPYDEDYGFSTVEAFLSKRPVLTTFDSGGVLEFVINDRNGYVADNKPESIAQPLDALFANRGLCHALGASGYKDVQDINWDTVINTLTAI